MSAGEDLLCSLLLADAGRAALVPDAHLQVGILPQGAVPGISILGISLIDRNINSPGTKRHVRERVQVSVLGTTPDALGPILVAVRKALADRFFAARDGLTNVAIQTDPMGPTLVDDVAKFYFRSQDFRVSYNEAR